MDAVFCVWFLTKFFVVLNCQVLIKTSDVNHHLLGGIFEVYAMILVSFALRPKNVYHYIPMCILGFITFLLDNIYCYYSIIYQQNHYTILFISCIFHAYRSYMFYYVSSDQHTPKK